MKSIVRIGSLVAISLVIVFLAFAGVIRSTPTASTNSDGFIAVTWQTDDETGVLRFEIWRAQVVGGNLGDFEKVGDVERPSVKPQSYEFIDRSVFKVTTNFFAYKVRVIFQNGTFSDSDIARTSHLSSTAKRTWGSIKAMFR